MITSRDRQALLEQTAAELAASEPEGVANANPFDCDFLDGDADHTMGFWRITYQTAMTLSTVQADEA